MSLSLESRLSELSRLFDRLEEFQAAQNSKLEVLDSELAKFRSRIRPEDNVGCTSQANLFQAVLKQQTIELAMLCSHIDISRLEVSGMVGSGKKPGAEFSARKSRLYENRSELLGGALGSEGLRSCEDPRFSKIFGEIFLLRPDPSRLEEFAGGRRAEYVSDFLLGGGTEFEQDSKLLNYVTEGSEGLTRARKKKEASVVQADFFFVALNSNIVRDPSTLPDYLERHNPELKLHYYGLSFTEEVELEAGAFEFESFVIVRSFFPWSKVFAEILQQVLSAVFVSKSLVGQRKLSSGGGVKSRRVSAGVESTRASVGVETTQHLGGTVNSSRHQVNAVADSSHPPTPIIDSALPPVRDYLDLSQIRCSVSPLRDILFSRLSTDLKFNLTDFPELQFPLSQLLSYPRPFSETFYQPVLASLSPTTFLFALLSLLLEKSVIFVSEKRSLSTGAISTFLELLHPLRWEFPVIHCLPLQCSDLLQAPVPILAGLRSTRSKALPLVDTCPSGVFVFLDEDFIICQKDESLPLPCLAKTRELRKLHSRLFNAHPGSETFEKVVSISGKTRAKKGGFFPSMGFSQKNRALVMQPRLPEHFEEFEKYFSLCEEIMNEISSKIPRNLSTERKIDSAAQLFEEEKEFYKAFFATQMAACYVEEHMDNSPSSGKRVSI